LENVRRKNAPLEEVKEELFENLIVFDHLPSEETRNAVLEVLDSLENRISEEEYAYYKNEITPESLNLGDLSVIKEEFPDIEDFDFLDLINKAIISPSQLFEALEKARTGDDYILYCIMEIPEERARREEEYEEWIAEGQKKA